MSYPVDLLNRSLGAWAGVLVANAEQYIPVVTELIYRKRILYAMMRKKGRFKFGESGEQITWPIQYKLPTMRPFPEWESLNPQRENWNAQAALQYKSWLASTALGWHDMKKNRGEAQLIDLANQRLKSLATGCINYFNKQMYENGADDATTDQDYTGFESMVGASAATCAAGDVVASPAGTYAGRSVAVGASSGSTWSANLSTKPNATIATDWPLGDSLSDDYDYWSPLLVNTSSTSWGTGGTTWADNCLEVIRSMIEWQERRIGDVYKPDLFLTETSMIHTVKRKLESRFRTITPTKEAEELGFPGTVNYDGVSLAADFNCPAGTGYLLPTEGLSIRCLTDDLMEKEGPTFITLEQKTVWDVKTLGNARLESPKVLAKCKAYA